MSKYAIECIVNTKTLFYAMKDHSSLKNYDQEVQDQKQFFYHYLAKKLVFPSKLIISIKEKGLETLYSLAYPKLTNK